MRQPRNSGKIRISIWPKNFGADESTQNESIECTSFGLAEMLCWFAQFSNPLSLYRARIAETADCAARPSSCAVPGFWGAFFSPLR